jgi:RNA polymerase sigma-70 factor, ECF subfamily
VTTAVVASDFADFYRDAYDMLVGSLRTFAGPAAEDVAQEAFIVAHERWNEIATYDVPFAWVRRVAVRIAGRRATRETMRSMLESRTVPSDLHVGSDDFDVIAALAELPGRRAAAVWLHYVEDRPLVEVADRLGCSVGAAKVLLLRSRRCVAERVSGLTGRWISERSWTPDGITRHLLQHSASEHVRAILDEDLGGRGGRWELTLAKGHYTLFRDDGMRLDRGTFKVNGHEVELMPALAAGHVLLRTTVDGNQLRVQLIESTSPPYIGVPDPLWWGLYLESGPLVYSGQPTTTG